MFHSKRIKKKLACKTESVLKDRDNLDIALEKLINRWLFSPTVSLLKTSF